MVAIASVLAAGASTGPVAPSPIATLSVAELAEGERLFQRHCGRCHGMRGAGGEGPSLNRPTLEHARDDEALFEVISEGIPGTGMPNTWAPNDREIWQIAGYVRTLGRLPSEPLPGDPAAGRTLYETTGNCGSCHIVQGSGRGVGPELTSVGLRRNAEYLRRALTDPDADSPMLTSQLTGRIDAFLTVRVVAADGEYEGLRVSEDEFSVQLRDLAGTVRSFDKGGLLDFEKAFGHSLMPGYETVLRPEEVNDLVAYLMTLKGVP
jgi:putative heme-binding domain-containing protein